MIGKFWDLNYLYIVKIIIDKLFTGDRPVTKSNGTSNYTIRYFLDMQNFDGLTALHYAAFRGNLDIIKYLTIKGANPLIKDKDGQNVIHIAAQGGRVSIIHYFLENFTFDINDQDWRHSTALHWAAYLNKEITLSYLIAWGANINAFDIEGNTPLHLAVVSSEIVKDTRCAKILLLKGAWRDIRNYNGHRPADLVKSGTTERELRSILKKPKYCTCLMLKLPPTKVKKSPSTAIFFVFLLLSLAGGFFWFIFPEVKEKFPYELIGFLTSVLLLILTFLLATFKDPGYLKQDKTMDFQELINTVDPCNICPDCKVIRTPRSRHCNICNRCVERFDHHWPYLNNCIGYRNHIYFLGYVILLVINLAAHACFVAYTLSLDFPEKPINRDNIGMVVYSVYSLVICGLFLPLVFFLTWIHSMNFCKYFILHFIFISMTLNLGK